MGSPDRTVPAILALWVSYLVDESSAWLADVLANAGVTWLVVLPVALLTAGFQRAIRLGARAVVAAQADVDAITDGLVTGREAIEQSLREEQLEAVDAEAAVYERWGRKPTARVLSRPWNGGSQQG